MIVNSSQGGGSKDTWILDEAGPDGRPAPPDLLEPPSLPDLRYGGHWHGQSQQQQQQGRGGA